MPPKYSHTQPGPSFNGVIVYTVVMSAEAWTTDGGDTLEGAGIAGIFLPSQDQDLDGLPDPGEDPLMRVPFTTSARRIRLIPPSELE